MTRLIGCDASWSGELLARPRLPNSSCCSMYNRKRTTSAHNLWKRQCRQCNVLFQDLLTWGNVSNLIKFMRGCLSNRKEILSSLDSTQWYIVRQIRLGHCQIKMNYNIYPPTLPRLGQGRAAPGITVGVERRFLSKPPSTVPLPLTCFGLPKLTDASLRPQTLPAL